MRRARAGDLFSESALALPPPPTKTGGSHKKTDETEGRGGRCERARERGQMSRRHGEKHTAFHQPPEKNVIHNSVDAAQP